MGQVHAVQDEEPPPQGGIHPGGAFWLSSSSQKGWGPAWVQKSLGAASRGQSRLATPRPFGSQLVLFIRAGGCWNKRLP